MKSRMQEGEKGMAQPVVISTVATIGYLVDEKEDGFSNQLPPEHRISSDTYQQRYLDKMKTYSRD